MPARLSPIPFRAKVAPVTSGSKWAARHAVTHSGRPSHAGPEKSGPGVPGLLASVGALAAAAGLAGG